MVKITLLALTLITSLSASNFEENCLNCHSRDFKFAMMMKNTPKSTAANAKSKRQSLNTSKTQVPTNPFSPTST